MNKREFVVDGMAAVVAVVASPTPAGAAEEVGKRGALRAVVTRTQRLPDLAERASAHTFEAYVGQRFDVVGGVGRGECLVVASVQRVSRCPVTEQFDVSFAPASPGGVLSAQDGVRLLVHSTGQRLALHLEHSAGGYAARFNLLA